MCDRKECRYITVIELDDGEKLYIHYGKLGKPPIYPQFCRGDYLAEYEIKI